MCVFYHTCNFTLIQHVQIFLVCHNVFIIVSNVTVSVHLFCIFVPLSENMSIVERFKILNWDKYVLYLNYQYKPDDSDHAILLK